jgi:hypothetical protein
VAKVITEHADAPEVLLLGPKPGSCATVWVTSLLRTWLPTTSVSRASFAALSAAAMASGCLVVFVGLLQDALAALSLPITSTAMEWCLLASAFVCSAVQKGRGLGLSAAANILGNCSWLRQDCSVESLTATVSLELMRRLKG